MRIIAGEAKGIRLKMVPGTHVRPTADRIKEALFAVIGPWFDGGTALDLFAGTGALGLESLSRGIEKAVFVDLSSASIQTIRQNIDLTKMNERAVVIRKDARSAIKGLAKRGMRFDLIFLDPPYQKKLLIPTLQALSEYSLLSEDGVIVAEHPKADHLPEEIGNLKAFRRLEYGDTAITLYQNSDVSKEQISKEQS